MHCRNGDNRMTHFRLFDPAQRPFFQMMDLKTVELEAPGKNHGGGWSHR